MTLEEADLRSEQALGELDCHYRGFVSSSSIDFGQPQFWLSNVMSLSAVYQSYASASVPWSQIMPTNIFEIREISI
jgi:hypothetical protein